MPDRLAEIRARLDAAQTRIEHNAGWGDDSQHQRVVQMNDMREVCVVADTGERKFIAHAPADIAWLLDRVRDLEVGILTACQIGSRGLNAQETQALASLMHDLDVPEIEDA
jgi:hypothetical protein